MVSMRMICTRQARAMASRRTSGIQLLHEGGDFVDVHVGHGDLRGVTTSSAAQTSGALHVLGDADDVVQKVAMLSLIRIVFGLSGSAIRPSRMI